MKKILLFGGNGLVGSGFTQKNKEIFDITAPEIDGVDILKKEQVLECIDKSGCETVINFAAITNVQEAEIERGNKEGICYKVNAIGARNVAEACKELDKHLIHISTEYIFDGTKSDSAYTEEDKPNPINWYGATKYFGEELVLQSGCFVTVMRICMPFSPSYELKKDIARFFLDQLKNGEQILAVEDQNITPTIVWDIAGALRVLIEKRVKDIYHVCSKNYTTPYKFAQLIAQNFDLDVTLIKPVSFKKYIEGKNAKLLKNSWLNPGKFEKAFGSEILHTIEESVLTFRSLSK